MSSMALQGNRMRTYIFYVAVRFCKSYNYIDVYSLWKEKERRYAQERY